MVKNKKMRQKKKKKKKKQWDRGMIRLAVSLTARLCLTFYFILFLFIVF